MRPLLGILGTSTLLATALAAAPPALAQEPGVTTRLGTYWSGIVTDDGRLVFHLVPASEETSSEHPPGIYVHDRDAGTDQPVSPATTGHTVDLGDVTPDGRYVHFSRTYAHPTRTVSYVLDRTTGERTRSSYEPDGSKGSGRPGAISDDGRIVSYGGYTRNMETGKVQYVLLSPSGTPRSRTTTEVDLSANGRYVTFSGYPKRGTRVDGQPARVQIWRHNRATGRTKLVTEARDGGLADGASRDAAMSADGRYVAFVSNAGNLTRGDGGPTYNVYLRDMRSGRTVLVSRTADGTRAAVHLGGRYARGDGIALSADARQVAFTSPERLVPEDTDDAADVYVRDRKSVV